MPSFWESIKVDGADMRLYVSVPSGTGPFPAVVVIQHQGGVDDFMEEMTQRVASAGYAAVAPDLYHRDGPDCKDDGPTRRARLLQSGSALLGSVWVAGCLISWPQPIHT
jgi:dienelactone hydrolase